MVPGACPLGAKNKNMNLIADYLARAAEARKTAETISDPQARAEILKIAEVCERLAARHPGPPNSGPLTLPPERADADKPAG